MDASDGEEPPDFDPDCTGCADGCPGCAANADTDSEEEEEEEEEEDEEEEDDAEEYAPGGASVLPFGLGLVPLVVLL